MFLNSEAIRTRTLSADVVASAGGESH